MRGRAVLALMALLFLPAAAGADEVSTLVDKVVANYGGRQKLAAIRTLHETGQISSLRTGQTGTVERWFASPDRLRLDTRYPNGEEESRILDKTIAYKNGAPAQGPLVTATKLQAARFRLPLLLSEKPPKLTGTTPEGWKVLAVDLGEGMIVEAQIDPAQALIRRSRGLLSMGGQIMEFVTDYDDFRKVDGVLVAHREGHAAMGITTGESRLDKVEINSALGDGVFKP
ncbi:MAG: hypothetical protein H7Z12_02075 [Rhodospirillaceae bacterium]|nr:hypothetical protein [Rhodospirillales bacterium]